ncbi:amino acid permease/ SLC12A domain-containing protein [Aspergillus leporis]|uniref:Amino acid permease/ SLC12A domain-containing protein n=1 Tax=Aspergillus leporis TaxID=41062 RepID=A0A5N5WKV0_9EURO|nr:amino acid permease/ SLC12A domain-containing protein [Aspergillus leporis]
MTELHEKHKVSITEARQNDLEVSETNDTSQHHRTDETHRGLKSRHIQLIAIGGTIGTALFVGSGEILTASGPASLLMAYTWMSGLVWFIMLDLGEMTAYMPIKGLTVPYLVDRFVDPSLAFATGWNYWLAFSINIAAEATVSSLVIKFWGIDVHSSVWITMILVVCFLLNIFAVAFFGEAEFWFASIKVLAILGLLILGVVLFFGGGPSGEATYFRYWNNPGAFNPSLVPGATGRFLAVWYAMIRSAYAFILSPELIPMTAGECIAPRRNIPRATSRYIYRLVFFYIGGALVIGVIIPYNDKQLLSKTIRAGSTSAASPFVAAIQNAGIPVLKHIVNAVILTSAWSSGNSFFYASSRMLYSMACTGNAPQFFAKCNQDGVPYYAVIASLLLGCVAYINASATGGQVFMWLTSIIDNNGFISWVRFRKATLLYGIFDHLPFKSPFQPYGTYFTLCFIILLLLTNGFWLFFPGNFTASNFLTAYISIPLFLVLYGGHKMFHRTSWYRPISEIDLFSGLEEVEEITAADIKPVPKNWLERIWFWIC